MVGKRVANTTLAVGLLAGILSLGSSLSNPSPRDWQPVQQRTFRGVPVVVVVFDELPLTSLLDHRDRIDERHFPNFARLERDSVWFRNTSAVTPFSITAMPSILTGKYPEPPPRPEVHPHNLFTLLGDSYEIRTPNPVPGLCPSELCQGAQNEGELEAGAPRLHDFALSARGVNFHSFLNLIRPTTNAHFYYLHLVMPHTPWTFLPSGRSYHGPNPTPGEIDIPGPGKAWKNDPWLVTQAYQRHLLQVRLVDRLLGAIVWRLKRAGLYQRSLLIVTADQGIAFEPGLPKRRGHRETVGQVAQVPFFVKRPFQRQGHISDAPVGLVDLVPTVADILDLSNVWGDLDGSSVFDRSGAKGRARSFYGVPLRTDGSERYPAIEDKLETFDGAGASLNLFRAAPGRTERLLGRGIHTLQWTQPVPFAADLDAGPGLGGSSSALIEGSLTVAASAGRFTIAIVVDGRIVALTKTFGAEGSVRFYSLLPPQSRDSSPDSLQLFVIERDKGRAVLAPIQIFPRPSVARDR